MGTPTQEQEEAVARLSSRDGERSDASTLIQSSEAIRREIVRALYHAGGGHFGGSLSVVDVLVVLYGAVLRVDPSRPAWPERDRLVLSKGHAAMALYAVLRHFGWFEGDLATYGAADSPFEGHPDMHTLPGVDFSTGSLGQGLSVALGMALALADRDGAEAWVVLGDGECQEGQVWEAAMLATRLGVRNLRVVVDCNGYQEFGWPSLPADLRQPVPDDALKWRAFGWSVVEHDGHDIPGLLDSFRRMQAMSRPAVLLARTVKGKGVGLIEADPHRFHCAQLSAVEYSEIRSHWT
jgi:transketolase